MNRNDKKQSPLTGESGNKERPAALRAMLRAWSRSFGAGGLNDHSGRDAAPGRTMSRLVRAVVLFVSLLGAWSVDAMANAITIAANTNWSAINTGSGPGGQPSAADTITVSGFSTLTVDVANGVCLSMQLGGATGGSGDGTLLFNSGSVATVAGLVTLGNGGRRGSIDMTNGGYLTLQGFVLNKLGTWTPGSGSVEFTATNTLPNNFSMNTFNNVIVSGGTTNLSQSTTVGALTVTAGTLNTAANTLNVTGNFDVDGTVSGTGAITLSGAGTNIDGTGSITNTATLTLGTGNKTILSTANLSFAGTIAINGARTITNNGTITTTAAGGITGTMAGSTWTNAANSTLNISGPLLAAFGTLNASANLNTINYAGAAQTVDTPTGVPATYYNLTLSGSGIKTMPAAPMTISGNVIMSGTASATAGGALTIGGDLVLGSGTAFNAGTFSHSVAGNFTNNGATFTASTSTVTLNGGAAQVIGGTTATTFNNLTISNAGGVTLGNNQTVSGVLTLTSGIVTTGANVLEVGSSCATGITRTGGYVVGNLSLHYPAGTTSCTFPVGDAANYTPVTVVMANVASSLANSILTARTDPGDHPDTTALLSGIDPGKSVNRYWTLTPGASLAFTGTNSATFTFNSDYDAGAVTTNFIVGRKSGGVWTYPTVGATQPTYTTATGLSGFGEFAIGQRAMPSIMVVKAVTAAFDPVNGTSGPKAIPGAEMLYTVTVTNFGPGSADAGTTVITDSIPANTIMCVSTICSNPVVAFTCSTSPACGLTFSYPASVTYSCSSLPCPQIDANGYGTNVTSITINPSGTFNGALSPQSTNFSVAFKVKIN